jgi:peptidoglycan/xylan/chitin deacetylase (PgdA/CDA1 family)
MDGPKDDPAHDAWIEVKDAGCPVDWYRSFGVGLVVFWMEPLGILSVIERITPNVTYRVRTDLPVVALSFDDGPHPHFTLQVLEILRQHDATATFFLIGERAIRYPDVVSQIKADGHEVGNHYFKNGPR